MSAYLIGFVCGWLALAISTLIGRSSKEMPYPGPTAPTSALDTYLANLPYDWEQHDDLS